MSKIETMRLDKLLADRGITTRKGARRLVKSGRVTLDGEVAKDVSVKVVPGVVVAVDGAPLEVPPVAMVFHKPAGLIVSVGDPWGRAELGAADAVAPLLEMDYHPVGRLDSETSGLLVLSRDGGLTHRLLHPKHRVEKVYMATVEGAIDRDALATRLAAGVETAEGVHTATLDEVEGQSITLTVTEGKHRMVRRMLANVGHPVVQLTRIRLGGMSLGDLPPGEVRPPFDEELAWLEALLA